MSILTKSPAFYALFGHDLLPSVLLIQVYEPRVNLNMSWTVRGEKDFIMVPPRDNDTTVDAQPSLIFKVINIRSVYFIMGQGSCLFKALLQVQQAPILPYLKSKWSNLNRIFICYRLRETHAATR